MNTQQNTYTKCAVILMELWNFEYFCFAEMSSVEKSSNIKFLCIWLRSLWLRAYFLSYHSIKLKQKTFSVKKFRCSKCMYCSIIVIMAIKCWKKIWWTDIVISKHFQWKKKSTNYLYCHAQYYYLRHSTESYAMYIPNMISYSFFSYGWIECM